MDYCVDWAPSAVSVIYNKMTWRREEINNMVRHDPAVNLLCTFSIKTDENLFYDVSWFINGTNVLNQTVDVSSNYTAVLSAYDILEFNKKIGLDVHCKVGAKRKKENLPCRTKVGNPFFAGIRVINPNIELERKGSENIALEMTIPFASESLFINGVLQPVSDLNIHLAFETGGASTTGGGGSSNHCEVKVKSFGYHEKHKYENGEWRQKIFFPVYSKDTDGYVISTHMTLHLKTGGTNGIGSKIFEHVSLQDILIRVWDTNQQWKGRSCGVHADPHMYTFDGVPYECQTSGELINYRNQAYLQWIQSKHHLCFPSYNGPWCVCAVAARAGRDVFLMDLCGDNGVINFELCEDNSLKVTKIHDKHYKVHFPTGTSLSIYIMEWNGYFNINLDIVPSTLDVRKADGLCGYFDGVKENDFKRRDSNIRDSINLMFPNNFSDSWRIPINENLLSGDSSIYSKLESLSTIQVPHCTCTESGKTECSYSTFTPSYSNQGKQYTCNIHLMKTRRRKRDISWENTFQEPLVVIKRSKRAVTYVQTEDYAQAVCLKAFNDSTEYRTCQQYVTDLSNVTLSNCIQDLKMTGDDNLTQIHVEAALEQCTTFVLLNATLQETEPNVTYTIQNLCPSNCSSHGTCSGGNCSCDSGHGGSDCSFDLLGPPTLTSVPSAGLCDLSSRDCSEATMFGKYFVENMGSLCYVNVKQVNVNQTTVTEEHKQVQLQERTLFEGFCPHSVNSSGLWITEITFNISNDGLRFTDTYEIYIYQSECQEYHNESGNVFFTLKENFCYIEGMCVPFMEESSVNECLMCNTTVSRYNWTVYEYCKQGTITADNKSSLSSVQLMTIIVVLCSLCGFAVSFITAIVIFKTCKKLKNRNQIFDTKKLDN
ncbi:von Willebrand factor D and EGF domain-containing protein-like [Saccostrea echinata]|uniref:von Willebrand factor D and EGF domain-containing protein-like n=1 Tax=Saccostrea echinata TaxID=191078 RepID=UPI002A7F98BD|nr:von Willebrand factor D and EGF domain-containing protein-like [Saccostrea echinata]